MKTLACCIAGAVCLFTGCSTTPTDFASGWTVVHRGPGEFVDVRCGPGEHGARFWSGVAGDERYPLEFRRIAIFELFRRYVSSGVSLSAAASVLARPQWLKKEDVSDETKSPRVYPFNQQSPGEGLYAIGVLPETANARSRRQIQLRLAKKLSKEEVFMALCGDSADQAVNRTKITGICLTER